MGEAGLNALRPLHTGVPIPESDAFVPWLIGEPSLYRIIPKESFEFSVVGWPKLRFTLLGVYAWFGFDFVTDKKSRLIQLQIHERDPTLIRDSFLSSSEMLLKVLGEPNSVNSPRTNHLRWDDGRVCVDNAIETGRSGSDSKELTWYSLDIRILRPRAAEAGPQDG